MTSAPSSPSDPYRPPTLDSAQHESRPAPKTWVAVALSLVSPGAGHFYAGAGRRSLHAVALQLVAIGLIIAFAERIGVLLMGFLVLWVLIPVDAARLARRPGAARPNRGAVFAAALGLGLLGGAERYAFEQQFGSIESFRIASASMAPALLPGDFVVVRGAFGDQGPQRGDLIAFRAPDNGDTYLMRIIGLPGDRIDTEGREVEINGTALERELRGTFALPEWSPEPLLLAVERLPEGTEHHVLFETRDSPSRRRTFDVPANAFLVLGDNRDNARDSRSWRTTPFVPREDVLGRVVSRYWSTDPESGLPQLDRIGRVGSEPARATSPE